MPTPNLETAAGWTGISALAMTLGTMLVRFIMKTVRTDRMESIATGADMNSYERLQKEIKRLEDIIATQKSRTDELEARLDRLRDMELDDVADISTLFVLVSNNCLKCPNSSLVHDQMVEILKSMKARKLGGMAIIRGTHSLIDAAIASELGPPKAGPIPTAPIDPVI